MLTSRTGVNFGTQFTSVVWAHSSFPDEVRLQEIWPSRGTRSTNSYKVPTELHYTNKAPWKRLWGYEIPPNWERLKGFNQLLQDTNPRPAISYKQLTPIERTAMALKELGISPVTAVADFLSSVRELTIGSIERCYGWRMGGGRKTYVLTVPASWTDAGKNHMVEAVEKAGFGSHRVDFHLVSEAEAAAG